MAGILFKLHAPGIRVGAILGASAKTKIVQFIGWGVYEGDFVPDQAAVGVMADCLRKASHPNPRIKLDSGKIVWGCECWWGPEDQVKAELEKYKAAKYAQVDVDIEKVRLECASS
jgi:hypothetical protein